MNLEDRLALAQQRRGEGYNCCQSVFLACRDLCDLPEEAAYMGFCFGGGMQCGSVCGALSGGLMAIGAALPRRDATENRPLAKTAALELEKRFAERFGTMLCSDILRENGKRICGDCVAFCTEAAAEIIEKINKGEL